MNNNENAFELGDYHKKESVALRKKNDVLEDKIKQQGC